MQLRCHSCIPPSTALIMIDTRRCVFVLFLLTAAPLVSALAGCGGSAAPESQVAASEGSVEKGVAAYAAGDWATA